MAWSEDFLRSLSSPFSAHSTARCTLNLERALWLRALQHRHSGAQDTRGLHNRGEQQSLFKQKTSVWGTRNVGVTPHGLRPTKTESTLNALDMEVCPKGSSQKTALNMKPHEQLHRFCQLPTGAKRSDAHTVCVAGDTVNRGKGSPQKGRKGLQIIWLVSINIQDI